MPQEHKPLLAELERALGPRLHNYLMLFLGFIRFAHFWTESVARRPAVKWSR
jgi:hypothetical protein